MIILSLDLPAVIQLLPSKAPPLQMNRANLEKAVFDIEI